MRRPIVEPGGGLLIAIGLTDEALGDWAEALYPQVTSLSVLIGQEQQGVSIMADEKWVYGPLGLRGALALIRRISWRHFDRVYQPAGSGLPHLRHFIWPRPDWRCGQLLVDFRP